MSTKGLQKTNGNGTIHGMIQQMKNQFAMALPKHVTPDRFLRVALTAVNKTPKLLGCDPKAVLACLMDCSQFGLEPDGRNAHLIPYGKECKLIFDYKGLVTLARNSGELSDIHADVVCENDEFSYSFGTDGSLLHKPALRERGEPIAAYSFVKFKDGSVSYEVMSIDEINATRDRSEGWKAFKRGIIKTNPWQTDWNEMAKKTVFRRHSKWLPISSEKFKEALEKDFDVPSEIINLIPQEQIEMPRAKTIEQPEPEQQNETEQQEYYPVTEEQKSDDVHVNQCSSCQCQITKKVFDYSCNKYGVPLCFDCQKKECNK